MKKIFVMGLLALLVVFVTMGSKCEKVNDPAGDNSSEYSNPKYAPPFSSSDFDDQYTCQSACNAYYTEMLVAENNLHSEIMSGLKGSSDEVKQLKNEEKERHKQEVKNIQEARQQCIRDCHDQGGSSGGF